MLEGDKTTKTIVYGTSIKGKTCYSGEPLIPTYDNQYDSIGNFAEYVVDAKADDNWIIAKTDHYCPVKFYQSESWRSSSGF